MQISTECSFVFVIGSFQNYSLFANFTGFPVKSPVLDNNLNTFYQPYGQTNQSWFLRLNSIYQLKWILVSIRGGISFFHLLFLRFSEIVSKKLNTINNGIWGGRDTKNYLKHINMSYKKIMSINCVFFT